MRAVNCVAILGLVHGGEDFLAGKQKRPMARPLQQSEVIAKEKKSLGAVLPGEVPKLQK